MLSPLTRLLLFRQPLRTQNKLRIPYQPDKTTWITYRYDEKNLAGISDDIIYALSEDLNTHSLWVGTRKGLSVLPLTGNYTGAETFSNYYPSESDSSIASDEVASLLRDRQGLMWVGMIGGGVNKVSTRKADFYWDQLLEVKRMLKTTSVRSILLDDEGLLWLGIGTYGLGVKNRQTGKFTYYTQMPEFDRYGMLHHRHYRRNTTITVEFRHLSIISEFPGLTILHP